MKKLLITALCIMMLALSACSGAKEDNLSNYVDFILDVPGGRQVKILQITDTQIIDSDQQRYNGRLSAGSAITWKPENMDKLAFDIVRAAVEEAKPDLIVLTGDNVYGEFDDSGTSLVRLVEFFESLNIPWTGTYGNHDNETIKGVLWQNQQYIDAKNCMFKKGNELAEGNGNYTIGIRQDGKLKKVLFMLDSHGCVNTDTENGVYASAGIMDGQAQWYEDTCNRIKQYNGGEYVESYVFLHHPLRAIGDAMQKYGYVSASHDFFDADGNLAVFSPVTVPTNEDGDYGRMTKDAGSYIDNNYSFFNKLKSCGTIGVFFGHEHENDISVTHEGVRLVFGVKSSKYDSHNTDMLGGTLIAFGEDNPLTVFPIYYVG